MLARLVLLTAYLAAFTVSHSTYADTVAGHLVASIPTYRPKSVDAIRPDVISFGPCFSNDRRTMFYAWDDYNDNIHREDEQKIKDISGHLVAYDISDIKHPRVITDINLGNSKSYLRPLKCRQNRLFLSTGYFINKQWQTMVIIYDISKLPKITEIGRIPHARFIIDQSVSEDGNVVLIGVSPEKYYDITDAAHPKLISKPTKTGDGIKFPPSNYLEDAASNLAMTTGWSEYSKPDNRTYKIWNISDRNNPVLLKAFTLGHSLRSSESAIINENIIAATTVGAVEFYSIDPTPVTAESLKKAYAEIKAYDVAETAYRAEMYSKRKIPYQKRQGYLVPELVAKFNNAGVEMLVDKPMPGLTEIERSDMLSQYAVWLYQTYTGDGLKDIAIKIAEKAVEVAPQYPNANIRLGDILRVQARKEKTDTAKSAMWSKARHFYAAYKQLMHQDPVPPAFVGVDTSNNKRVTCDNTGFQDGCGYSDAMKFDMENSLAHSSAICDYVTATHKDGNLEDVATTGGRFEYLGKKIDYSFGHYGFCTHEDTDFSLYMKFDSDMSTSLVGDPENKAAKLAGNLPGFKFTDPTWPRISPLIIPYRGKDYMLTVDESGKPLHVYEPVKGQVCEFQQTP